MSRQSAIDYMVGLVDLKGNTVPASVAREAARIAAGDASINDLKKRYFGYARFVPERSPDVMTMNANDLKLISTEFRDHYLADPRCVWVGIWDNQARKLISDSLGASSIANPPKSSPVSPSSDKGKAGIVIGAIAAGVGIFIATRKKG